MEKKIYSKPEALEVNVDFQGVIAQSSPSTFSISNVSTEADASMTQKQDTWSSDSWQ